MVGGLNGLSNLLSFSREGIKKNKSPETMECQAGPICSVSSDASSAVRHNVELFYYYEKVSFINRLKLYSFIEVVIMTI